MCNGINNLDFCAKDLLRPVFTGGELVTGF
jgi:hypothetical protein